MQDWFTFQVTQEADTVAWKFPEEISELNVYVSEHFCVFSLQSTWYGPQWETTQSINRSLFVSTQKDVSRICFCR